MAWPVDLPDPPPRPGACQGLRWLKATCHVACILGKEGKEREMVSAAHSGVVLGCISGRCAGDGVVGTTAEPWGPRGSALPSPYLPRSPELELLETNLETRAGRLQRLPPGSAEPQRSLFTGAGEQTRFSRGDEMRICASASPPFLQFPQKKKFKKKKKWLM